MSLSTQALGQRFQLGVRIAQRGDRFYRYAEQVQQQSVAIAQVAGLCRAQGILQEGVACHALPGGQSGCLAHVIGLYGSSGHQAVGAGPQRIGAQVFELANLVAAHGQRGEVITLDPDVAVHVGGETLQAFQRGGGGH